MATMAKKITAATEEILKEDDVKSSKKMNAEKMTAIGHTAWRYKLQGHSYTEIGRMLGVTTSQIKHYISAIHDEYKLEVWHDVEEFRQSLAMQLLYMGNETQKLWTEAKLNDSVSIDHIAYLENNRKMIKDVRDLMGLDAPKRTEMQVSTGEQPYTISIDLTGTKG